MSHDTKKEIIKKLVKEGYSETQAEALAVSILKRGERYADNR